jgi:hypothetical protein
MAVLLNHFLHKLFQHLFVGKVANEVITLLPIYYANRGSCLLELLGNASSDALCATCHDDYFIFEIHMSVR